LDASAALGCFGRIQAFLSKAPRAEDRVVIIPSHLSSGSHHRSVDAGTEGRNVELQELGPAGDSPDSKVDVTVRNASFSWSNDGPAVLDHINMDVRKGQLAMIVGPVASGKTTLLRGPLGELPSISGQVKVGHRRVAYCEQTPWLFVCAPPPPGSLQGFPN
jgi:ABC-type multidrug transport system fused ATPase/permease subunit